MSKKLKGFSLAELLISLLVISIVLSAAIPTITKRTSQDREQIWKWSTDNNSTYFGLGSQQSVLIGTPTVPTGDVTVFMDEDNDSSTNNYKELYINQPRFTTAGDKLAILKQSLHGQTTNMANSHISFYTIESGVERNASNIVYAGRIATDNHNLAFGKGTLLHQQDITDTWLGENTAIGHYTLMSNVDGIRNVAVGEKALSRNNKGMANTAIGFGAANQLGREKQSATDTHSIRGTRTVLGTSINETENHGGLASSNTAIGYYALKNNATGYGNTAVGSVSNEKIVNGDDNTSVGSFTLGTLEQGYGNTALGANACGSLLTGNYNICIGNAVLSERINDNYGLSIGSTATPKQGATSTTYTNNIQHSIPLITGHTQRVGNKINPTVVDNNSGYFDKELIVNAKRVAFRPFNGGLVYNTTTSKYEPTPTFVITSVPGDINEPNQTGYGDGKNLGISAKVHLNLRYDPSDLKSNSVAMEIHAADEQAIIGTFNPTKIGEYTDKSGKKDMGAAYKDISLNQVLRFDMPFKGVTNPMNNDTAKMLDDSNIIDPTAEGLIRSGKYKVGILGEFVDRKAAKAGTIDYKDTFELLLNSKVNISRVAAHVFNIDENGTQIRGKSDNPKPFEIVLGNDEFKPDFRITDTMTNIKVKNGVSFYKDNMASNILYINDKTGEGLVLGAGYDIKYPNPIAGTGEDTVSRAIAKAMETANAAGGAVASDARLKNISGDSTAGLAEINKLEVKNYTYKKDEKKTPHVGVIAQQLQKVFPDAVTTDNDGYLRIRTEDIFYAMVNSIKELCAKLQDLTAKVVGLDKRITELEAQNKMLLEQNKAFEKRLEKLEKQAAK